MNRRLLFSLVLMVVLLASCDKRLNRLRQKNLNGARVALLASSMQEVQAKNLWPNGHYRSFATNVEALEALRDGEVDALYIDQLVMYDKSFHKDSFDIAFMDNDRMPIAGAFRKTDTAMADEFANFLREIKSNGIFVRMKNRWTMAENIDTISVPIIPPTNKKPKLKTLVVGIMGEMRPYSIEVGGQWTGFENEIWACFAEYMGYKIRYDVYDFNELIPALLDKKVDVIAAAITVTEERERKVLFTQPYSASCSVCLIRK